MQVTTERPAELARSNVALLREVDERQRAELLARGQIEALTHTLQGFAHS